MELNMIRQYNETVTCLDSQIPMKSTPTEHLFDSFDFNKFLRNNEMEFDFEVSLGFDSDLKVVSIIPGFGFLLQTVRECGK